MRNETKTLWLSLGSALFAIILIYKHTQEKASELTKQLGAQKRVIVAREDIRPMEIINENHLEVVEKPLKFVEKASITNVELAIGQVALAPINKGEQILENKIIKPGPVTGLSLQVTPKKRAITIPANDNNAVGRLIKPGDRVDILVALDSGKGINKVKKIKTLLQDVIVLATGVRVANDLPALHEKLNNESFNVIPLRGDTKYNHITLEVVPKDAQKLAYILATNPGSIFLTLRNPSDQDSLKLSETSVDDLLTKKVVYRRPAQAQRAPVVVPQQAPQPKRPAKKKKRGPFIDL